MTVLSFLWRFRQLSCRSTDMPLGTYCCLDILNTRSKFQANPKARPLKASKSRQDYNRTSMSTINFLIQKIKQAPVVFIYVTEPRVAGSNPARSVCVVSRVWQARHMTWQQSKYSDQLQAGRHALAAFCYLQRRNNCTKVQPPGVEPGPLAWRARILTVRPRLPQEKVAYESKLCRLGIEHGAETDLLCTGA